MRSTTARHHSPALWAAVLSVACCTAAQGQGYFQQRVDHSIDVQLDDVHHILRGTTTFTYTNHAPTALDTLWVHLWPNAYRDRHSALCKQKDAQNDFDLHFAQEQDRGWIDSLAFSIPEGPLAWGYHRVHGDIAWVKLPGALATAQSISITTPFRVKVPDTRFSRLGHTGQAYYISQWYPKPAVYDSDGWHAMPYLDQGEFYSDPGHYDVRITLPANYVLAATGERSGAPAEEAFMDSLAALPLHVGNNHFPPSSPDHKTIRFVQDNVHDFAWFADKRYQVRKGRVKLERSGRHVATWALFTPRNALLWADAITYVNESVRLYSQWVGDYEYGSCTAVDGTLAAGGGMEYPTITIIGDMGSPRELDEVIAHEVGHNWFYGMLASNERQHPWMDEGMNSFFEKRYMAERYPGSLPPEVLNLPGPLRNAVPDPDRFTELMYRYNARRNWDQPADLPATAYTPLDYGVTVYGKSALIFQQLQAALGEDLFDACTRAYFAEWSGKHPRPQDVRASYEKTSGRDLSWCFEELMNTAVKPDVRALKLRNGQLTYRSTAQNGFPIPVTAWHGRDSLGTTWHAAVRGRNSLMLPWPQADRAVIDAEGRTLDIDRRNNEVRSYGLLKRSKLPDLKFLAGVEREDRRTIYWTPAIGYNAHDGLMPGLALANTGFPSQRLEWAAAPLYGLSSGRPAGGARVMWSEDRFASGWLRNLHVGASAFGASLYNAREVEQWYRRLVPSIQVDPRLKTTGPQAYLRYRSILTWEHAQGTWKTPTREIPVNSVTRRTFHEISAAVEQRNGLNPFTATVTSLNNEAFSRLSLEATWSAIYDRHKHRLSFRAFAGTFLRKDQSRMQPAMGWRMYWGSSDLLYDHLYIDRQYPGQNTSRQFNKDQGGFKTPTSIGTSDSWIGALNMEIDFPFALPLAAFGSYGAAPITLVGPDGRRTDWQGNWELGIGVRVMRDVAEIWVPLAFSDNINKEQELRGFQFTDRIRIVLALEKLDPSQALRKLPH